MKGYVCPLYILPFDHRSTFARGLLDIGYPAKGQDKEKITWYKKVVFDAYLQAIKQIHCPENTGILVDEFYGDKILKQAAKKQLIFALPVEKSGQASFKLKYGNQFGQHISKYNPTFVKALIRYNPANRTSNQIQLKRLKKLNDYCEKNGFRLLVEPLIPPTIEQLKKCDGDQRRFDKKLKPDLMIKMVRELHKAGIDPDVWKVEALETKKAWNDLAKVIRNTRARRAVNIIMLGRNANKKTVDQWIKTAASTGQVNGFAVGRTVFYKSLEDLRDSKTKRQEAVDQITKNYIHYINLWQRHAKNKIKCVCPM